MEHLFEKTRDFVLQASDISRIEAIRSDRWIGYPQSQELIKKLENLLSYPKKDRMPNLLLVGHSNNGKTAILRKFYRAHESYLNDNHEVIIPVLMIQAPPEPDEKRLYNAILDELFAPYRSSEKAEVRQQRVFHLMKKVETKVLVIDEIHHVLTGSILKQRLFLNVLKLLSNELRIPIVCAGTQEAFNVIQTDPQLANRFETFALKKWTNEDDFLRLLISFERLLPLKSPSNLVESSMANKILSMSEGYIGEIACILELSAIMAIESGIEKINGNILNNINYFSPSDRKRILHAR